CFLGLQFGGIEHSDQVSSFHRSAFIHQQSLNAAFHLCADDYLIRIDRTDEHQIFRVVGGKIVVSRGNHEDDAKKNGEFVASTHERTPDFRNDGIVLI